MRLDGEKLIEKYRTDKNFQSMVLFAGKWMKSHNYSPNEMIELAFLTAVSANDPTILNHAFAADMIDIALKNSGY